MSMSIEDYIHASSADRTIHFNERHIQPQPLSFDAQNQRFPLFSHQGFCFSNATGMPQNGILIVGNPEFLSTFGLPQQQIQPQHHLQHHQQPNVAFGQTPQKLVSISDANFFLQNQNYAFPYNLCPSTASNSASASASSCSSSATLATSTTEHPPQLSMQMVKQESNDDCLKQMFFSEADQSFCADSTDGDDTVADNNSSIPTSISEATQMDQLLPFQALQPAHPMSHSSSTKDNIVPTAVLEGFTTMSTNNSVDLQHERRNSIAVSPLENTKKITTSPTNRARKNHSSSSSVPWKCSICEKVVRRDISRHLRTHDKVSRFRCIFPLQFCRHKTGQFNRPYDFKKHLLNSHFKFDDPNIKKLHNLKDKLPHIGTCSCGLKFQGQTWLENHILTEFKELRCPYISLHQHELYTKGLEGHDDQEEEEESEKYNRFSV